jgi:hypothetical protein
MQLLVCLAVIAAMPMTWDFEGSPVGELPAGWSAAKTGEGPGSLWKVVDDGGSKVLAQTSPQGPNPLYNLCIADDTSYRDLTLSVSVMAVKGKIDQGGGLVWRYRDRGNYYIARWNPLETNFRVYKVVDGKRTQLATADVAAAADQWHKIKIDQVGQKIRCYLDGKLHLEAADNTFNQPGKIGLWTKADAQTYFNDLSVGPPEETP